MHRGPGTGDQYKSIDWPLVLHVLYNSIDTVPATGKKRLNKFRFSIIFNNIIQVLHLWPREAFETK